MQLIISRWKFFTLYFTVLSNHGYLHKYFIIQIRLVIYKTTKNTNSLKTKNNMKQQQWTFFSKITRTSIEGKKEEKNEITRSYCWHRSPNKMALSIKKIDIEILDSIKYAVCQANMKYTRFK